MLPYSLLRLGITFKVVYSEEIIQDSEICGNFITKGKTRGHWYNWEGNSSSESNGWNWSLKI